MGWTCGGAARRLTEAALENYCWGRKACARSAKTATEGAGGGRGAAAMFRLRGMASERHGEQQHCPAWRSWESVVVMGRVEALAGVES
jgi:hypothetical protein